MLACEADSGKECRVAFCPLAVSQVFLRVNCETASGKEILFAAG